MIPLFQYSILLLLRRFALRQLFQDRIVRELAAIDRSGAFVDVGHHPYQVFDGGLRRHQIDSGAGAHLLVTVIQGFFLVGLNDLFENLHRTFPVGRHVLGRFQIRLDEPHPFCAASMPPRMRAANLSCEPPSCSKVTSLEVLSPASSSMTRRISDDFPPSRLMPTFFPLSCARSSIFSRVAMVYETRLPHLPSDTTGTP